MGGGFFASCFLFINHIVDSFFQASRKQSPDSSTEEVASENQQSVEKIKQEKTAEPKQVQTDKRILKVKFCFSI